MSRYGDDPTPVTRVKGPNWGRVFAVVLSIVLAVVLIGGVAIYTNALMPCLCIRLVVCQ